MPIYQYRCVKGHLTDDFVKSFKDAKVSINCPICHREAPKIISKTTFKLGGSCWASDGYKGHSNRRDYYDE